MASKRAEATAIVRRLRAAGHEAYFAGGCVRDQLLGVEPQDFDIATSARPDEVQVLFPHTVPVGAHFGVILVIRGGATFEVATFRSDAAYLDGRHPVSVRFGSAVEDASRRDFTINGLFLDPLTGRTLDHVGGQADLAARAIRAIGDPAARFAEDRLRMMRAVRLAARLGFSIEAATRAAISAAAPSVAELSAERIGDEVVKILTEGQARRGFELLDELGLLAPILPEVAALHGVEQSRECHPEGDAFAHTMACLGGLPPGASETLALAALLHDIGKPGCARRVAGKLTFYGHTARGAEMAVAVCQRLRRSRATWERVAYLVRNHLRLLQAPRMRLATLKRMLAEEGFAELLALARLDALASNGELRHVEFCQKRLAELGPGKLHPRPLLGGNDLLALGYPEGPLIGRILAALEEAQLEDQVRSPEEARRFVLARFPVPSRTTPGGKDGG